MKSVKSRGSTSKAEVLPRLLRQKKVLVLDGAMGTILFAAGITHPTIRANVERPEVVRSIHQQYVEAGSDLILTNTFVGGAYQFHRAGADIAREVADAAGRPIIVAGSIGTMDDLEARVHGLVDGGVDVMWLETMRTVDDVHLCVEAIRTVCDLPICATMSFHVDGRTASGLTRSQFAEQMAGLDLFAIGANCGTTLDDTETVIDSIRAVNREIPIIVKPNGGLPELHNRKLLYNCTLTAISAFSTRAVAKGATLIGTCCGTTPAHIATIRQTIDKL